MSDVRDRLKYAPRGRSPSRQVLRLVSLPMAAGLSSLALVACGGHTASKQDVIAQGNAICAGTLRDLRAAPPPASGQGSASVLAEYLQRVLPILRQEVSSLRALPRPAQDRALLRRYIDAVTRSGSAYRSLAAAASRGDQTAVNQALTSLQANPAAVLAGRYGMSQCASAGSTAVAR